MSEPGTSRPAVHAAPPIDGRGGVGLPGLFSATLALGAALLFSVQPMVAKRVLPGLGGAPAVWNTCMVFFQAALLAGYAYVHAATARLGPRGQAALHAVLMAAALLALPIAIAPDAAGLPPAGTNPAFWLLGMLLRRVGPPFFVVAATAPLLQRWFARTGHPTAMDPYFLYSASNLGSLIALLGYPLAVEPALDLTRQSRWWAVGYGLLAVLTLACAAAARRPAPAAPEVVDAGRPGMGRWSRWVALAFVPSSLLLGVTTFLTTEIAAIPLLWVVPLAIYLLTFVLVFARRPPVPHELVLRLLPLAVTCLAVVIGLGATQPGWIALHLLTFFAAAMACHGELARLRPPARDLTAFYLAMAVGGVLGGAFNALIAPALFDRIAEYPLALVLACLARPTPRRRSPGGALPLVIGLATVALAAGSPSGPASRAGEFGAKFLLGLAAFACYALAGRPVRFAAAIGAVLAVGGLSIGKGGPVEYRARSFFGVLKVVRVATTDGGARQLVHGRTLHGEQRLAPALRREPLTYFTRSGPCGDVFAACHARARPAAPGVAIIGLGAGSLACYAEAGQRWTFYEIDPDVARVAADPRYFTFLGDCRAGPPAVVLGDARLRLRAAPDRGYGLIVMDAFSGDAVPVHLLTREALRLYRAKLAPGGLIAVQITNNSIDFAPVLGALAADAGMICRVRTEGHVAPEEARRGKYPSRWAVLVEQARDLGPLAADPRWVAPRVRPGQAVWRDDFANLVENFWLWGRSP